MDGKQKRSQILKYWSYDFQPEINTNHDDFAHNNDFTQIPDLNHNLPSTTLFDSIENHDNRSTDHPQPQTPPHHRLPVFGDFAVNGDSGTTFTVQRNNNSSSSNSLNRLFGCDLQRSRALSAARGCAPYEDHNQNSTVKNDNNLYSSDHSYAELSRLFDSSLSLDGTGIDSNYPRSTNQNSVEKAINRSGSRNQLSLFGVPISTDQSPLNTAPNGLGLKNQSNSIGNQNPVNASPYRLGFGNQLNPIGNRSPLNTVPNGLGFGYHELNSIGNQNHSNMAPNGFGFENQPNSIGNHQNTANVAPSYGLGFQNQLNSIGDQNHSNMAPNGLGFGFENQSNSIGNHYPVNTAPNGLGFENHLNSIGNHQNHANVAPNYALGSGNQLNLFGVPISNYQLNSSSSPSYMNNYYPYPSQTSSALASPSPSSSYSNYYSPCRSQRRLNFSYFGDLRNIDIYSTAKDYQGCLFLRMKFESGNREEIRLIFSVVKVRINDLMVDRFGNYLVQSIFRLCDEVQMNQLVLAVTNIDMRSLIKICCNMHGSGCMQELLEQLKTQWQKSLIISTLCGITVPLVKTVKGHPIIMCCLKCFSSEEYMPILNKMADNCHEIATHKDGCRIAILCVWYAKGEPLQRLIAEITANALVLSLDQYGNYVVQEVLKLRSPIATQSIALQLIGRFVDLSMDAHASHVVEKVIKYSEEELSKLVIEEIRNSPNFEMVVQDPYGNYVAQTMVTCAKGQMQLNIVEFILKNCYASLKCQPHGKKVLERARAYRRHG